MHVIYDINILYYNTTARLGRQFMKIVNMSCVFHMNYHYSVLIRSITICLSLRRILQSFFFFNLYCLIYFNIL